MGTKRVEGKQKKKSIKAKVTTKFSSKRKLSRMGKKVKKGMMGPSTEFITRSAVLKKLQITLKDFRRLCILKGIYPRVPEKAPEGSDKVYYDIKDISYLAHEPLLAKFRDFKAFMKKIRKASGRRQYDEAQRKDRAKPVLNMDHLVRERYPRFVDALRDLDDPLCMIHLFAALPSIGRITSEKTVKCQELAQHWQYIIMKSKTLRKVFVSVKGLYFQVEFMGESITWIVPHAFTQTVPKEVDVRVMITFLDLYEVLIKFVLFKLYDTEGLNYPPIIDKDLYNSGCSLLSVKASSLDSNKVIENGSLSIQSHTTELALVKSKQSAPMKIPIKVLESLDNKMQEIEKNDDNEESDDDNDDEFESGKLVGPLSEVFENLNAHHNQNKNTFSDDEKKVFQINTSDKNRTDLFCRFKFFINREVPLNWMQFCILSFSGLIGWEGSMSPFSVDDPSITHHVIDRPMSQESTHMSREYIQPQWIFDCINMKMILPTHHYKPGCKLPPHLSPFVDDDKEGYVPKYKQEILKLKNQLDGGDAMVSDAANDDDDDDEDNEVVEKDDDDDDDEDEEEDEEMLNKVETKSSKYATVKGPKAIVHEPKVVAMNEDEEANELSKLMMSKKTKRLYGRMQHGIQKKKDFVDKLMTKRKGSGK